MIRAVSLVPHRSHLVFARKSVMGTTLFKHYSIVELSNPDEYNLIHILQNARAILRHNLKIGKLAGFHSATWQDFIRQLGDYVHDE